MKKTVSEINLRPHIENAGRPRSRPVLGRGLDALLPRKMPWSSRIVSSGDEGVVVGEPSLGVRTPDMRQRSLPPTESRADIFGTPAIPARTVSQTPEAGSGKQEGPAPRVPPLESRTSNPAPGNEASTGVKSFTLTVPIDKITPNPDQPRKHFDAGSLAELAESLRTEGLLQPIIVASIPGSPGNPDGEVSYQIIAGERRWQAARLAGLSELPVIVKNIAPDQSLGLALIENLQREDLNPIEEASAYDRLCREFGFSHEQVAGKVGKSRPAITNALRLLALPTEIVAALRDGIISQGQARPLLALDADAATLLFRRIVKEGLSSRYIERLVGNAPEGETPIRRRSELNTAVVDVEERLTRIFGRKVRIVGNEKKGSIRFEYYTKEDLINLADQLLEQ